jgi:hypothetical protein
MCHSSGKVVCGRPTDEAGLPLPLGTPQDWPRHLASDARSIGNPPDQTKSPDRVTLEPRHGEAEDGSGLFGKIESP